ncbi:MAG: galactose mutarotase [Carboxylicivirga sp.]|jgi:aldose 1-epimerase|nr:galactose mutarotase [Carboxylicivirga sp.]
MKNIILYLLFGVLLFSCKPSNNSSVKLIPESNFNTTINGKAIKLFTLKNSNGIVTQITNYGGRVVNLWTPDKNGRFEDIVLGYESIDGYLNSNEIYFGALIGRYGNRLAKGQFTINNIDYTLAVNNGENHLHGGVDGFNNVVWDAKQLDESTLELSYLSKDMEEGYPGNLKVKVIYSLTDQNELKILYKATTDAPTYVNLTHHSFFNLHGAGKGSINDHVLMIDADHYTPVDEGLIPTGEIAPVRGTPMDFTQATAIGERVDQDFEQLIYGLGYDHNWVLNGNDKMIRLAASVLEPKNGRMIEVWTNEPGLQFYGGNFLEGKDVGKYGLSYKHRTAFCLETQHYPDSPNHAHFPSTLLSPGEEYESVCIYKFK